MKKGGILFLLSGAVIFFCLLMVTAIAGNGAAYLAQMPLLSAQSIMLMALFSIMLFVIPDPE